MFHTAGLGDILLQTLTVTKSHVHSAHRGIRKVFLVSALTDTGMVHLSVQVLLLRTELWWLVRDGGLLRRKLLKLHLCGLSPFSCVLGKKIARHELPGIQLRTIRIAASCVFPWVSVKDQCVQKRLGQPGD